MTFDGRQHYVYDAWNRMVAAYANDDGDLGNQIARYEYDGRGYRVAKAVALYADAEHPAAVTGYDRTDFFYNESWQAVEQRLAANCPFPAGGGSQGEGVATDYVWDQSYIDTPVLRIRTAGQSSESLYYAVDANKNVTALVDPTTGSVVERYVYSPYGETTTYSDDWTNTVTWENSQQNDRQYCGYVLDAETALNCVRNRYYAAWMGTWTTRDPGGYVDGPNTLAYSHSEPISGGDPLGLAEVHGDVTVAKSEIVDMFAETREALEAAGRTSIRELNRDQWLALEGKGNEQLRDTILNKYFPLPKTLPDVKENARSPWAALAVIADAQFELPARYPWPYAGISGFFVVADVRGVKRDAKCRCDFSGARVVLVPAAIVYEPTGAGVTMWDFKIDPLPKGPILTNTIEHERVHLEGVKAIPKDDLDAIANAGFTLTNAQYTGMSGVLDAVQMELILRVQELAQQKEPEHYAAKLYDEKYQSEVYASRTVKFVHQEACQSWYLGVLKYELFNEKGTFWRNREVWAFHSDKEQEGREFDTIAPNSVLRFLWAKPKAKDKR